VVSSLSPTAAIKQRTLNFRLRLYLSFGLLMRPQPADGFPNFKIPVETSTTPNFTWLIGSQTNNIYYNEGFYICQYL